MADIAKSPVFNTTSFYDDHAEEYFESTVHLDLHELYERFLKGVPRGGRILDAGCGSGRDTKAFLERGYRVTAIDASPQLARLAGVFTGQHCEVLSFLEMRFREEFDGIWACASLLHIPKNEIRAVMSRFIKALKPGGVIYISLKEGHGERIADDGRFFCYYTGDSFRHLFGFFPTLREIDFWKSEEMRSGQHANSWLNFLMQKVNRHDAKS